MQPIAPLTASNYVANMPMITTSVSEVIKKAQEVNAAKVQSAISQPNVTSYTITPSYTQICTPTSTRVINTAIETFHSSNEAQNQNNIARAMRGLPPI